MDWWQGVTKDIILLPGKPLTSLVMKADNVTQEMARERRMTAGVTDSSPHFACSKSTVVGGGDVCGRLIRSNLKSSYSMC